MDKRGTNKFNVDGINVNGVEHVFKLDSSDFRVGRPGRI